MKNQIEIKIKNVSRIFNFKRWLNCLVELFLQADKKVINYAFNQWFADFIDEFKIQQDSIELHLNISTRFYEVMSLVVEEYKKGNYLNAMAKSRQLLIKVLDGKPKWFLEREKDSDFFKYLDQIFAGISNIRHLIEKQINGIEFKGENPHFQKATCKFIIEIVHALFSFKTLYEDN